MNHGGDFLLVRTEEYAYNPIGGLIDASAMFRYWNATELLGEKIFPMDFTKQQYDTGTLKDHSPQVNLSL